MNGRSPSPRSFFDLAVLGAIILGAASPSDGLPRSANYLHAEGSDLVDDHGRRVVLTGINWFGLETPSYAPHGLWARNWEDILNQIRDLGFNTIRLPYSTELFEPTSTPNGIDDALNPDLAGMSGLEIMDRIVAGAGERGLKVILDRHRADSSRQSDLWYTTSYGEARWIADWVMLAERYAGSDTVIGVDLHNEPHGRATWGTGDEGTDWRLAAERAGNAILEVNPRLLIIVQGVDQYRGDWYWWGGNLAGVREQPVRLSRPSQLVYSTHEYGPGVYPQPWFWDPSFPANLAGLWDRHWAFVSREGIAPVIVGEFGGRSVGEDREGIWQKSLITFLRQNNLSYFYWTLNPNSSDTGGLLLEDWLTADPAKLALLSGYQFPLLGIEEVPGESGRPLPDPAGEVSRLQLRYRAANTASPAHDTKPEFVVRNVGSAPVSLSDLEIRYWFSDTTDRPLIFHCDWAAIGCGQVIGQFFDDGDGLRYLRLSFREGLSALGPGAETGEIKVRFNRDDWSEYLQTDDYSFGPVTEYAEWPRVSLHLGEQRVWGVEPFSHSGGDTEGSLGLDRLLDPLTAGSPMEDAGGPSDPAAGPGSAELRSEAPPTGALPGEGRNGFLDLALLGVGLFATAYGLHKLLRLIGWRRS